jgi:hypothetical protein
MSFVLPRNSPKLTFGSGAFGAVQRPSKPPPLPHKRRPGDVYALEVPTPYLPSPARGRAPMESFGDDVATLAMRRASLGQAMPTAPHRRASLPVFNFHRAVDPAEPLFLAAPRRRRRSSSPLTTVVWLVAALLSGVASFEYTPQCLDGIKDAVQVLERH